MVLKMSDKDYELATVARYVVCYQVTSIIMVFSTGFISKMIKIEIYIPFIIMTFFFFTFYIFFILFVKENICPKCNNSFFKKKNEFLNIGFSIYTRKCTNCGYKLNIDKGF